MPTLAQLRAHSADLETLINLAIRDLDGIWSQFTSAEMARDGLMDVLPDLIDVYGSASAALGADWYDELREQAEVPGRFPAVVAPLPPPKPAHVLARWSVGPLFAAEPDWAAAKALVDGGLEKAVADLDRESFTTSAVQDPMSEGWKRVGSGKCDFCAMVIGRGIIYRNNPHFASHNNCTCTVISVWTGQPEPVNPYAPSERLSTPASRARVREWLKANPQS